MMEREYVPAPCRVIYTQDGGFTPDAQPHHLTIPLVRDLPPEKPVPVAAKGAFRRPEPPRRERPAVDAQPTPKHVQASVERQALIVQLFEKNVPTKEIAAQAKCSVSIVYARLKIAGRSLPPRWGNVVIQVGERFGSLVVIRESESIKDQGRGHLCKCDCGKETLATVGGLRKGVRTSCGCRAWSSRIKADENAKAVELHRQGRNISEIARRSGVSRTQVRRLIDRLPPTK